MSPKEYTILKFIGYKQIGNWSVRHILGQGIGFNRKFITQPIGSFVKQSSVLINVQDDQQYKQVTLKTKGGGAVLRDIKMGKDIGTKKQYVVSEGQFIMSKIDARNGAFGIVPKDLDGAIVTADFPVFNVETQITDPEYLALISSTNAFARFAQSCSRGTTNRQRIDIKLFLSQHIPTPTLPEQQALVKAYNERIKQAQDLEEQASQIEKEIEEHLLFELGIYTEDKKNNTHSGYLQLARFKNIEKWSIEKIYNHGKFYFDKSKYPITAIKTIVKTIDGGKTPSTSKPEYWNGTINWVSAKDMKELFLENIQDRITETAVSESGLKIHPEGSILCVFRSGILRHSFPICTTKYPVTINQDLKALTVDEMTVSKMYFVYYLRFLQEMVLEASRKKGVTVESINLEEFLNIPIILPPQNKQIEIVNHINLLLEQIKQLRHQAEDLRKKALEEFEKEIFE